MDYNFLSIVFICRRHLYNSSLRLANRFMFRNQPCIIVKPNYRGVRVVQIKKAAGKLKVLALQYRNAL